METLARIMMGKTKCVLHEKAIFIGSPTPLLILNAEEIYNEVFTESLYLEILTREEIFNLLLDVNFWSLEEEDQLNSLPEKIKNLKLDMYNSYANFKSKRVEQLRKAVISDISTYEKLHNKKFSHDIYTCEGLAFVAKTQYLVSELAEDEFGNKISFTNTREMVYVTQQFLENSISETEIRKIARSSDWQTFWIAGKAENKIFGIPSILMSREQRSLISWSRLYDQVAESMDRPDENVVNDDFLLDGWLIAQQAKRENEQKQSHMQKISPKMANANEIFIPVETKEDAQRVNQLNSSQSKMLKRQRMKVLTSKGVVSEEEMPDSQLKIRQQAVQLSKRRS